jgi:putative cell wall-binding protein
MPTGVLNYINSNDITKVYVIGGPAVISDVTVKDLPNVERIYGQDRYETNTIVMSKFKSEFDFTNIYYATPNNFPDALSGAALAAKTNSPIILIDNNTSNFTLKFISDVLSKIRMRYILGGTGVLSDDLMNSILN